ncbi:hypothetical protein B0T20DRAFT_416267 [Sordaria brevicollis]|uniref:Uncharacterized protein n=1 Tax=Sordaria brevicollis TaxID=83679 RepID=A0AAE0P9U7_SORBR|nr:hypothetical protein B0T20DRAFT_416267 [Sordaria brevicollis]
MSFNTYGYQPGFPPGFPQPTPSSSSNNNKITSMTGNGVLNAWWQSDVALLVVAIPHKEFITMYCPNARPTGIARLKGHRLATCHRRRYGKLVVVKVNKWRSGRASSSSTRMREGGQPTGTSEISTDCWSQEVLERPTLTLLGQGRVGGTTMRHGHGQCPQSTKSATHTIPDNAVSQSPASDTDDSVTSFVSAADTTDINPAPRHGANDRHQPDGQQASRCQKKTDDNRSHKKEEEEEEVWGILYLLTTSQYNRLLRGEYQSQSHLPGHQPHFQTELNRGLGQLQLGSLPRPFGITIPFTMQTQAQAQAQVQPVTSVTATGSASASSSTSASASASTSSGPRHNHNHNRQKKKKQQHLPQVQVDFFPADLLHETTAHQHSQDAKDVDVRPVKVFLASFSSHLRGGHDDPGSDEEADAETEEREEAVAEALEDFISRRSGGAGKGGETKVGEGAGEEVGSIREENGEGKYARREEIRNEVMYLREQRRREKREEMVQRLKDWGEDLEERGVPGEWVESVVLDGLIPKIMKLNEEEDDDSGDEHGDEEEEEVLGLEENSGEDTSTDDEEWNIEGQVRETVGVVARNLRGVSRNLLGFARRGVGAMVEHIRGGDAGDGHEVAEEWEVVPD